MQKITGSSLYMHLFELILKSEQTGLYQYVLVQYRARTRSYIAEVPLQYKNMAGGAPASCHDVHSSDLDCQVQRLCSVWFSLVQVHSGVQDSR